MKLRYYQQAALDGVYNHLRVKDNNPCVVIPTGGGKGFLAPTICNDVVTHWGGRVLVLAHVKELIQQLAETAYQEFPDLDYGIYHAGLKKRDMDNAVIFAGIQSVYQKACQLGKFDIIVVDECHTIPPEGEGRYQTFLNDAHTVNPNLRIVGLTATPYRMGTGTICGPDNMLNEICYEVGVKELIENGYLCNIRAKSGNENVDTSRLHIRGGEFIAKEVATLMDQDHLVKGACREIVALSKDRKAVLMFATSVEHGRHIQDEIIGLGEQCEFVYGDMVTGARDHIIKKYKNREIKYLVNVNVLTTGFDAPHIDTIAMLRPTLSPGLYYQMLGRGFRICQGKKDCLILDYANNVKTHGPVDELKPKGRKGDGEPGEAPVRECPDCHELVHASVMICTECGYEFPERELKHESKADTTAVISQPPERFDVEKVSFFHHQKKGGIDSLRVEYQIGFNDYVNEWICLMHPGFAGSKAAAWWKLRTQAPMPTSIEHALELVDQYEFRDTESITTKKDGKFTKIITHGLGSFVSNTEPIAANMELSEAEIPF